MIRTVLPGYEQHIRRLPLSSSRPSDRLVWLPQKNGKYSVRSGYGLSVSETIPERQRNFNWQKNIWKLQTVPKVKQFLWRAVVEAFPVGVELVRRGIQVDFACKICGNPETITHVLRDCQLARKVWNLAPLRTQSHLNTVLCLDFLAHILSMVSLPPIEVSTTSLPAWICWNLWTPRNHRIFSDTTYSAYEIITKAICDARAWQEAQSSLRKPQSPQVVTSPPPTLSVICNVDAAWHADSGHCGLGFTFRPLEEDWPLQHSASPLISVVDAGYASLQVRSDSQTLMNLLNSQDTHTEIHAIVNDIRLLALSFSLISFIFVPCTDNVEADTLAKDALRALLYHIE
ncbi:hypothetical protein EUTSA_v10028075mg [Eutrema salsugineum]|uniref:Reverse transcriptase zinc-binding domain-containing protein n=1 Tax=Eutrema salsugineum TaxID=72664 RepID=V4NL18_EUTSA|nr:hypothetical protein EUTSA_v10028075mg [Eutrema salsugineum]